MKLADGCCCQKLTVCLPETRFEATALFVAGPKQSLSFFMLYFAFFRYTELEEECWGYFQSPTAGLDDEPLDCQLVQSDLDIEAPVSEVDSEITVVSWQLFQHSLGQAFVEVSCA